MIVTQQEPNLTVPVTEDTVFQVTDDGSRDRQFIMVNTGTNTITYKFQYSADRSSWTDLESTSTIAPGSTVVKSVSRPESFLRLRADGNSTLQVTVTRYISFSGTFSLVSV